MLFMSERQAESGECLPAMQAASVDDDGDVVFRLSLVFLFERAVDVTCDTLWAVVSHISQLSHTHTHAHNQDTRHWEDFLNLCTCPQISTNAATN